MTKSRIFLNILLSFVVGVAIRSFFAIPYGSLFILSFLAAIFLSFGILKNKKMWIMCGAVTVFFIFGVVRFDAVEHRSINQGLFGAHIFRGIVYEEPENTAKALQIVMSIESFDGKDVSEKATGLITTRKYPEYRLGDELVVQGTLEPPQNNNDFDHTSYLQRRSIDGTISFPEIKKVGEKKGNQIRIFLSSLKRHFEEKIDILLPEPYAAFLQGLLLGERATLPEGLLQALKKTGTTHVVALSGYNITIVGTSLLGLLLFFGVSFRVAFWIASSFIVFFVILTGASASVVRAGIMGLLVLIAQNHGRAYHMTNALVFAAAVMIADNPFILRFDAGFQLSFLATCGIMYLPKRLGKYSNRAKNFLTKKDNRKPLAKKEETFLNGAESKLIETLSAEIMVLPLLIYLFGTLSLISPLVNILILPFIPYAMGAGFFAVLTGFLFLPLARMVVFGAWVLLAIIIGIIEWCSELYFSSVSFFGVSWYFLVIMYGAIGTWLWQTRKMHTKTYGYLEKN